MTITSIGSSFSYIRPDAVARETAASAVREDTKAATDTPGFGATSPSATGGSAKPSVADDLRAKLVETQESARAAPPAREVSRAYGGR